MKLQFLWSRTTFLIHFFYANLFLWNILFKSIFSRNKNYKSYVPSLKITHTQHQIIVLLWRLVMLLKKKWSYSKELNNLKNFISCNHHHISVLSCIVMCMLFCNIFMNYPTEWYLEIEVNIRLYYKISYWAYCYFYFPWWLKCLWTSGSNLEIHLHERNITLNMNCNIYNQCRREIESQTCKGQKI